MNIIGVCGAQGAMLFKLRKHLIMNIEYRSVFHFDNQKQWKCNFGNIPLFRNLESVNIKVKDVDMIIGSPSCGHSSNFSYSRKKSLGKPKEDESMKLYINSIHKFKPKTWIMENLPKLIELVDLKEWEKIFPEYNIIPLIHPVSVFGNSQVTRKRLLLIGVHKTKAGIFNQVNFKDVFKVRSKSKTCSQLHKHIRPEYNYNDPDTKKLSMYYYNDPKRQSLMIKEIKLLWETEFKDHYRWPMFGHKMNTLPGVYRNKWDSYPLTIRPSNRQFDPNGDIMGIEWFRLIMGYPTYFKLYMDENRKQAYINNLRTILTKGAVFEIGTWIYRLLLKYKAL